MISSFIRHMGVSVLSFVKPAQTKRFAFFKFAQTKRFVLVLAVLGFGPIAETGAAWAVSAQKTPARAMTVQKGHTHYPLTLSNCGRDITFTKKPQSVVAVGQASVEILYLLGLADKVKATALWFGPVLPQFTDINKKIKVLADNDPGFESVVAERPDMVANQFEWQIGPVGVVGTYEQFAGLGIPVYTSPADCIGKDNLAGSDGLRSQPFTMDMIYQEISELAQIFDVRERGEQLVAGLKQREAAARAKIGNIAAKKLRAVFWFSSADLDMDPYVAGRPGAPGYVMNLLGIDNVIESDNEWPTVGWETIAKGNPDILVLAEMTRRRFPLDDVNVKRHYLESDPVTKLMPAVRDNKIITINAQAMNPGIRVIDGLEHIANSIRELGLDH